MGFVSWEELLLALNERLDAERVRAGAQLVTARKMIGDNRMPLVLAIHRDEARWCCALTKAIQRLERMPSTKADKAVAIPELASRLAFLSRGVGWVVCKLKTLLPTIRDEAIPADLVAMLASHARTTDRIAAQVPTWESQGGQL